MYISIDLGASNTRVAASLDLKNISKVEKFETQKTVEDEKKQICSAINEVDDDKKIKAMVLSIPGIVDKKNKQFKRVPNFPALSNLSITDLLGEDFSSTKLFLENDAEMAGLGEAVLGAGKDYDIVAYLTISTGVGGLRIENKKLSGIPASLEPGHQIIVKEGRYHSGCGQHGCLEAYISGTAFKEINGVESKDCSDPAVWKKYSEYLGVGLINIIAMWDPNVIILGGGVSKKFDTFYPFLIEYLKTNQAIFEIPDIKQAKLGDDAGLYGGFVLIDQTLNP